MRKLAIGISILILVGACSSNNGTNSSKRPTATAKLAILQPTSGQTLDGKDVEVKVRLDGGTITHVVTKNVKPNVGHIHLYLDGKTITILGSLDNHIKNVTAGQHILQAQFVAADHLPFANAIQSSVTFNTK